jgi:hypothetical protein
VSVAADAPAALPLPAAAEATEEEEHDGCDGANPRRRLDNALLSLADGILLRLIVTMTTGAAATAVRCTATATMSMPTINVVAVTRGRHGEREETTVANVTPRQTWRLTRGGGGQKRWLWRARGDGSGS